MRSKKKQNIINQNAMTIKNRTQENKKKILTSNNYRKLKQLKCQTEAYMYGRFNKAPLMSGFMKLSQALAAHDTAVEHDIVRYGTP